MKGYGNLLAGTDRISNHVEHLGCSRASGGTRDSGKLETACQSVAAYLRHHGLEGSCLDNNVAFQGKEKKMTVKKLLSLIQTLNLYDNFLYSSTSPPFCSSHTLT